MLSRLKNLKLKHAYACVWPNQVSLFIGSAANNNNSQFKALSIFSFYNYVHQDTPYNHNIITRYMYVKITRPLHHSLCHLISMSQE